MASDVASLVRESLVLLGCDEGKISQFDHHSAIELSFSSVPSIYISDNDGDVWVWSRFVDCGLDKFMSNSQKLLPILIKYHPWSRTGQVQIGEDSSDIEIKAMIHGDYCFDAENFSKALNGFYGELCGICEIMK